MARVIKARGTCPRLQVGAVLVTPMNKLAAVGYNGAPTLMPHCIDEGCILEGSHCVRAVHAELNAILNTQLRQHGMTLYTTHYPCSRCMAALCQIGVKRIVYGADYRNTDETLVPELAKRLRIELVSWKEMIR
jgi:dCMP deaminase